MQTLYERIKSASEENLSLFFTGQAGFIIKNKEGKLLGIDLYLSNCVERLENSIGYKRLQPSLLDPGETEMDILIATHPHLDHFDEDAIPDLMKGRTKLFASVQCRKLVEKQGIPVDNVNYIKPGDCFKQDGFIIRFVSCDHGTAAPDAVGVLVETDGKVICETGDTCIRPDFAEEYLQAGSIDVLIAPINGAFGNMNEEDCAKLSGILKPDITIPCHYGMFASHGGSPEKFINKMKEICPDNKICLMAPGDELKL